MTNAEIFKTISAAVEHTRPLEELVVEDIVWAITTNPDLVLEINRRYTEWLREMNETHPDPGVDLDLVLPPIDRILVRA